MELSRLRMRYYVLTTNQRLGIPHAGGLADGGSCLMHGMVGLTRRSGISGLGIAQGLRTCARGRGGLPTGSRLGGECPCHDVGIKTSVSRVSPNIGWRCSALDISHCFISMGSMPITVPCAWVSDAPARVAYKFTRMVKGWASLRHTESDRWYPLPSWFPRGGELLKVALWRANTGCTPWYEG